MATTYADLITLKHFLPVYDMLDESPQMWEQFIPTQQFRNLLSRTLTSFTSPDVSKRRSIWVRGTFGTGKSHASAVVKHLLCDPWNDISTYVQSIEDDQLRSQVKALREKRKFFAVTLKGVEHAYDVPHFSLALQRETQKAVAKVAPDLYVKSDFQTAIEWIENHRDIFDQAVLHKDEDLSNLVDNTDQIINRLKAFDTTIYQAVEQALNCCLGLVLQHSDVSHWLAEVEQKIEEMGIAQGLVIFWDEFTSVMDTLKSDRINVLQNISEMSQNKNVFLFLISHRVKVPGSEQQQKDISKMSDRFEDVSYTMDEINTYLIMEHSLLVSDENRSEFLLLRDTTYHHLTGVIKFLTQYNPNDKPHLQMLFPLHPFTAYLCSTLSRNLGSANRSVIKFLHDEEAGLEYFLHQELPYQQNSLLTCDALWDFFYSEFDHDADYSPFTSVYHSYIGKVKQQGIDYTRVFKAIILLNALKPKFGKEKNEMLSPTPQVIGYMFEGDPVAAKLNDILDFLDESNIINKSVLGEYKIAVTQFDPTALNAEKDKQRATYKLSTDILRHNPDAKSDIESLFSLENGVHRKTVVEFYACEDTEAKMKSYLYNFSKNRPNHIHVAVFTALTEEEKVTKDIIVKNLSKDNDGTVCVVPDVTFTADVYDKFIAALASQALAHQQFNENEAKEQEKHAKEFVKKWVSGMLCGNYTIYFNGQTMSEGVLSQIGDLINHKISAQIFSKGFECVKDYATNTAHSFFTDKNCPKVIIQILQAVKRDDIIKFGGNSQPIVKMFESNGNFLVTPSGELSDYARETDAWIAQICKQMDECMANARKKYADRFDLAEVLDPFRLPPFGFYTSFAHCAALAFAIRPHKADLFVPGISQPVSDEKLSDFLKDICAQWREGNGPKSGGSKWQLRFGSPEESKLAKLLVEIFDLNKLKGANDIKSLDSAKWHIDKFCKEKAHQPLWVLKYAPIGEDNRDSIEALVRLLESGENHVPTVQEIKEIYTKLSPNHIELNIIATNLQNYNSGFYKFLDSIDEVTIKKEWHSDIIKAVNNLQEEVAFRHEDIVRKTVLKVCFGKLHPQTSANDRPTYDPIEPTDTPIMEPANVDKINMAKNKVKQLLMPNMRWQKVILELIERYPGVADYCITNLE